MARKRVSTTVYLEREQDQKLRELSDITSVPVAVYIRRGIDQVLEEEKHRFPVPVVQWPAGGIS